MSSTEKYGVDFVLVHSSTAAASPDYWISGTVKASPADSLSYLVVTATPVGVSSGAVALSTQLGPSNYFEFHKVKPGQRYSLQVSASPQYLGSQNSCEPGEPVTVSTTQLTPHATVSLSFTCLAAQVYFVHADFLRTI